MVVAAPAPGPVKKQHSVLCLEEGARTAPGTGTEPKTPTHLGATAHLHLSLCPRACQGTGLEVSRHFTGQLQADFLPNWVQRVGGPGLGQQVDRLPLPLAWEEVSGAC